MSRTVFMFDGQGAFKPGIGKDLAGRYEKTRQLITKSSEILGYDLSEFLWGEKANQTSTQTSIAQPAISVISLAYAEVLKDFGLKGTISLGHSLGEVTAIVYCGIVSFEDGIKIIQKRGELMEKGGKKGSMMAVLNIDLHELETICRKVSQEISEPVVVANINGPSQIVISGSKQGIQKVAQIAVQSHGRGIPLSVGGAWHSPYLKAVAEEFAEFLDKIDFRKPARKFYSVVEQKILEDAGKIKDSLKHQMLAPVNWVSAIENLKKANPVVFLEIGPSKILKDLVVKIDARIKCESTAVFPDLQTLLQNIKLL